MANTYVSNYYGITVEVSCDQPDTEIIGVKLEYDDQPYQNVGFEAYITTRGVAPKQDAVWGVSINGVSINTIAARSCDERPGRFSGEAERVVWLMGVAS